MDLNSIYVIISFILIVILAYIILELLLSHKKNREIDTVLATKVFLVALPKEGPPKVEGENEPPKDFRQLIAIAEQMFVSLGSLYIADIKNKILKEQEQISFEIIAKDGLISFYVACPRMLASMLEKQIQGSYPTARIEQVRMPNIFLSSSKQKLQAVSAQIKLAKKFVLPIKTYMYLESDPLNGLTNSMSKLGENSAASFQMIIRPTGHEWRGASMVASRKIQEGKTSVASDKFAMKAMNASMGAITNAVHGTSSENPNQPKDLKTPPQYSPMQENLMKALNDKASKNGFEVVMRVVATAPDILTAQSHLQTVTSSFSQFGSPEINNFKISKGNAATLRDFVLRRFSGKKFILNTEELATVWHLPNYNIDTPNIHWLMAKELPPPTNLPQEGTVLGKSVYRAVENLVKIKPEDRRRHIFMIGKTGVGKTTLFTNAIEQDIREDKGCCFIDPLGDAIEDILGKIPENRYEDVILFDPSDTQYPSGLNLLEWKNPEERDFLIQETIQIFYKLFDPGQTGIVGPQWEHWFRNAALTVMNQPGGGTLIDIARIFTDDAYRTKVTSYVTDPIVKSFWTQQLAKTADFHKSEMYNYFISKFGRFMTNDLMRNIIGQKKSSFDIRQAMDSGKILLINLSKGKIGEVNSNLLGMIVVSKIQMAAFSRADISEEERHDFYLYVDEFQNFTTDSFATILSEARKYRLNLNVTNQYIAQLTEKIRDAVIGNAGTLISYRIGAADAEFLVKEFPGVLVSDMTNLDQFNTYTKLLIDGTPSKPFSMKGVKSPTASNHEIREYVRALSRHKYSKVLAAVQKEIGESLAVGQAPPAGTNEPLNNL